MHRSPAHGAQAPAGPLAPPVAARQAIDHFATLLETEGLAAALSHLAALTGYRHAALLRREAEATTAVAYVDRADPNMPAPSAWPRAVLDACFVRDGRGRVVEAAQLGGRRTGAGAAAGAARREARPEASEDVGRCASVPVLDAEGRLYASLCLFDEGRRGVKRENLALLLEVASLLAQRPERVLRPARPGGAAAARAGAAAQPWLSAAGEEDPGSALDSGDSDGPAPPRRS